LNPSTAMNRIDLSIILVILLFFGSGILRGFFRELIEILSAAGGFLLAVWKTETLAQWFSGILPWSTPAVFLAVFFVLFTGCSMITGFLLRFMLRGLRNPSGAGNILERTAGSILGLFRGVLFVGIMTLIIPLCMKNPNFIREKSGSILFKPFRTVVPAVSEWTAGIFPETASRYAKVKEQFIWLGSRKPVFHSDELTPRPHDAIQNK
jgi:uncharacterized membrane protein required for colicin V production